MWTEAMFGQVLFWLPMMSYVTGSLIHVTTEGDFVLKPLYGDAMNVRCQQWLRFQVKAATSAHVSLLTYYNASDTMYDVVLGGWANTKSVIRRSRLGDGMATFLSPVLDETQFRSFWVSWGGGVIALGQGEVVGSDEVMSLTDSVPHDVNYVAVTSWINWTAHWIIEAPECTTVRKSVTFEQSLSVGLYRPDPRMLSLTEVAVTQLDCSSSCLYLVWCMSFSYNPAQQECRMFDTSPSGLNVSEETGWKTWAVFN